MLTEPRPLTVYANYRDDYCLIFVCWLTTFMADLIIIVIIILFKYQHTMQVLSETTRRCTCYFHSPMSIFGNSVSNQSYNRIIFEFSPVSTLLRINNIYILFSESTSRIIHNVYNAKMYKKNSNSTSSLLWAIFRCQWFDLSAVALLLIL